MLKTFVSRIDRYLQFVENRRGLILTSIVVGLLLMILAAIFVTPALEIRPQVRSMLYGKMYQAMSVAPLDFSNPQRVQLRILTPLLSYIFFLRGSLYMIFPLLVAWGFLTSIYYYFKNSGWSASEALGASATMAFAMPVLLLIHYAGYTDVTSYLLIFGAMVYIRKNYIWPFFFCLALFNHECNLFAAPWLILLASDMQFKPRKLLIATALVVAACIPLLVYRHYMLQIVPVELNYSYYLDKERVARGVLAGGKAFFLGVFSGFKLFWVFPLIGIYAAWKRKAFGVVLWFVLVLLLTFGQFLLASDITRIATFAWPAVLMGVREARGLYKDEGFSNWLWGVIMLNFLVPQYYAGRGFIVAMWPLPLSLILLLFGIDAWDVRIW